EGFLSKEKPDHHSGPCKPERPKRNGKENESRIANDFINEHAAACGPRDEPKEQKYTGATTLFRLDGDALGILEKVDRELLRSRWTRQRMGFDKLRHGMCRKKGGSVRRCM